MNAVPETPIYKKNERAEKDLQQVKKVKQYNTFSSWTWKSFLFVGFFHLVHIGLFCLGWFKIVSGTPLPGLSKLHYSVLISRGAAIPLSFDLMLLLLPMCRISITKLRYYIRWTPIEETTWFHRQIAYTMLFYAVVHTSSHYVNFYLIEKKELRPEKAMQIHYTQAAGITGHVMLFCMVLMYTFAHEKIRQQSFEAFQWAHRLYIVFLFAAWFHGAGCFIRNTEEPYYIVDGEKYWEHCIGYQSWRWETWFAVIYLFERIFALIWYQRKVNVSKVLQHPSNVLEIQFDRKGMEYKAGQWIFLQCPELSKSQWHPFSISSCPYDPYVSVHIRQVGDFTRSLRDVFDNNKINADYDIYDPSSSSSSVIHSRIQAREMPSIIVEGPYGAPAEDIFGNEVAVLIGAGIGVTPWASVLKSLWHIRDPRFAKAGHKLRRVEFIWTCKDLTMFEWFQNLISSLNDQSAAMRPSDKSIRLYCHTYITRPGGGSDLETREPSLPIAKAPEIPAYSQFSRNRVGGSSVGSIGSLRIPRPDSSKRLSRVVSSAARAGKEHHNIHTGRPDFPKIFREIKDSLDVVSDDNSSIIRSHLNARIVGVSFCGPKPMAKDIQKACQTTSTTDIKFRFKKESF